MRALNTADIFLAMRIIKELDLKEQLQSIAKRSQEEKQDVEKIGADLLLKAFDLLTDEKAEQKIYEFLAGPFEVPIEDVSKMPIDELIEKFTELNKVSNLGSFFTSLSRLNTLKSSTSSMQGMAQKAGY